ncbi:MAG: sigma-70 family RNA polymerase sigma factor, partial [Blautia sp.]|nr:sigma-70 family RNA polymerase sigma factor [Blautia sp.]
LVEDVFDIYQAEDVTYPENCLLVLEDAIKELGSRQADILRMRYQENQVYDSIANSFGISKERVRQIIKRAIQQLQTPLMKEAFGPILEGGKSRQEMKRLFKSSPQRTKKTIEMYVRRFEVPAAESLAHQELLKNYELSSRCVKCLQRHGYTSVGQVLWLYKKDPDFESLHNFGTKSKAEIMDLLGRLQLLSDGK